MKKTILCVVFCAVYSISGAQVLKLPLLDKQGTMGAVRTTQEATNVNDYKGIDSVSFKEWSIQTFNFSGQQADLNTFLKNKISKDNLLLHYKKYQIDTTYLTDTIIPENEIAAFVAVDVQEKWHIKVDVNNNKNFADDKEYVFDKKQPQANVIVNVKTAYFDGSSVKYLFMPLTVSPKSDAISVSVIYKEGMQLPKKNRLALQFVDKSYKEGLIDVGGQRYLIKVYNEHHNLFKNEDFGLFVNKLDLTKNQSEQLEPKERYRYGTKDSIHFGKYIYLIDSLANNNLFLKRVGLSPHEFGTINTVAPEISGNELLSQKKYSLKEQKGKYVLVDFWGTWCTPCIEALPQVVRIKQKYNELKILSIALDSEKDLEKLKQIIKEKGLSWDHLFMDKKGSKRPIKDYQISAYPTTLLINPTGKIVLRGIGVEILQEIDKYLATHHN